MPLTCSLVFLPSFPIAVIKPTAATAAPSSDNVDVDPHRADHGYHRVREGSKVKSLRCESHWWNKTAIHYELHNKSDEKSFHRWYEAEFRRKLQQVTWTSKETWLWEWYSNFIGIQVICRVLLPKNSRELDRVEKISCITRRLLEAEGCVFKSQRALGYHSLDKLLFLQENAR